AGGIWSYARESKQRHIAEGHAEAEKQQKGIAEGRAREAELSLAHARLAEGDALIAADEIGRAAERYEEARQVLERNGVSTFVADLCLWNAYRMSPPPLMEFTGHTGQVNCAAYLPGGRRIVTGSEDGTGRLW